MAHFNLFIRMYGAPKYFDTETWETFHKVAAKAPWKHTNRSGVKGAPIQMAQHYRVHLLAAQMRVVMEEQREKERGVWCSARGVGLGEDEGISPARATFPLLDSGDDDLHARVVSAFRVQTWCTVPPHVAAISVHKAVVVVRGDERSRFAATDSYHMGNARFDNIRVDVGSADGSFGYASVRAILSWPSPNTADANCSNGAATTALLVQWYDDTPFPLPAAQYTYRSSCRYSYVKRGTFDLISIDSVHDHAYICPDFDNDGAFFVHSHLLRDS